MKNFRKTIIALATVAAMLVPSVAMAATLTTTVDKDITGDVYVGFYDGAILKDVVKTTVDDITVSDATPAGTEEELPCTVEITDVVDETLVRDDGKAVHKLVFTAKADYEATMIDMMLSYDKTDVTLVTPGMINLDLVPTLTYDQNDMLYFPMTTAEFYPYKLGTWQTVTSNAFGTSVKDHYMQLTEPTYRVIGDRVAMKLLQSPETNGETMPFTTEGTEFFTLYFVINEGGNVDKDTFKIETEIGEGTFHSDVDFSSLNNENGIRFESRAGALTYGCWLNKVAIEDTIKLVTPWDVQESTTKTLTVTTDKDVAGYDAVMYIWDENQIAQCAPITTWN